MKILVTYSSVTGNTKLVATKLFEYLKEDNDVDILKMIQAKNIDNYDVIFIGFWINKATANKEAYRFIEKIKNRRIALFGTIGANPDSEHGKLAKKNIDALVDKSNDYIGSFLVNGKVDDKWIKRINIIPFIPKKAKEKMQKTVIESRAPNEDDFKNIIDYFSKRL